jgi:dihydrofolate synthase / folylpolyglutamate synthase
LDFDEALAFLDDRLDLEQSPAIAGRIEGLSLEPTRRVMGVLGDPQRAYPVIHLTGTNGKGSTARMVSALLMAQGLTVGTYTSPHFEDVAERVSWNLEPISHDEFARVVGDLAGLEPLMREELRGVSDQPPTYFELLTAAAFTWFAEVAADVAVIEVGMLGAWDATNVADADVAVVTNIGRDHTDGVGDWRQRIAQEKSGIIKPDSRVVLGETSADLRPIFEARPAAGTWVRDDDFGWDHGAVAIGGRVADLHTPNGSYDQVFLPLHGSHQLDNAAAAVAAVESFLGRRLDETAVREAFGGLTMPGRFEVLHRGPLMVLDGAHNPDGAASFARTLAEEFDVPGRRRWVLGLLAGRDVDLMLDGFGLTADADTEDEVVVCLPGPTRGAPTDEVAERVASRGIPVEVIPDVASAVLHAWEAAAIAAQTDEPGAVFVTGSLRTTGLARPACRKLHLL